MRYLLFVMSSFNILMMIYIATGIDAMYKSSFECIEIGIQQKRIDGINQFFYRCLDAAGDKGFGKNQDIVEQCWKQAEIVYGEQNENVR